MLNRMAMCSGSSVWRDKQNEELFKVGWHQNGGHLLGSIDFLSGNLQ